MNKKILTIIMAIIFIAMPLTVNAAGEVTAYPSGDNFIINGKDSLMDAYMIDGFNYVKLTDIEALLKGTEKQFSVAFDSGSNTYTYTTGEAPEAAFTAPKEVIKDEKLATPITRTLKAVNGEPSEIKGYLIDGEEYFRLRMLRSYLDFGTAYDFTKNKVMIDSENANLFDIVPKGHEFGILNELETNAGVQKIRFLIYGFEECPYCVRLKAFLDEKGIDYLMANVRKDDTKTAEIFEDFYTKFDKEYDRVYYPTLIMTLEEGDKKVSKAVVGFSDEEFAKIFEQIKTNTYFED